MCCVPHCRGNYGYGPKVSVFYFPNDESLRLKWISAVHRQDWMPSKHSVLCELHLNEDGILCSTSMYDPRTGKLFTAPLDRRRLRKGRLKNQMLGGGLHLCNPFKVTGMPFIFVQCSNINPRDTESHSEWLENSTLHIAIRECGETLEKLIEATSFCNKKLDSVWLLFINHNPYPRVVSYSVINSDLFLSVFIN
ncbi:uncharacterized protein LOC124553248 [Schistocerca americana]|uniref:uncharacterized protein LOC124553248 n=1 Tax=Schistocerca americana TaxID=7009 RepID=UPI001F4F2961|nr:uncharacterized protein LOC124553248 [Schistocerca americana]